MTRLVLAILLILSFNSSINAQQKTDTIKCYVQIMIPATDAIGLHRNIEDSQLFLNGGILLYTKAYAIKTNNKYTGFLTPKRKELKKIWKPKEPQVMEFEW
jgi:hypothetical protein